jgi:hypothetical protein
MTDYEKDALAWLDEAATGVTWAKVIQRMLDTKLKPNLYRIRGKGLDLIHEGPISISEARDDTLPDIEG